MGESTTNNDRFVFTFFKKCIFEGRGSGFSSTPSPFEGSSSLIKSSFQNVVLRDGTASKWLRVATTSSFSVLRRLLEKSSTSNPSMITTSKGSFKAILTYSLQINSS